MKAKGRTSNPFLALERTSSEERPINSRLANDSDSHLLSPSSRSLMQACTPAFSPHTYQSRRTVLALESKIKQLECNAAFMEVSLLEERTKCASLEAKLAQCIKDYEEKLHNVTKERDLFFKEEEKCCTALKDCQKDLQALKEAKKVAEKDHFAQIQRLEDLNFSLKQEISRLKFLT